MITYVEMQAMEMLVSKFLNREGFEREHYALGAMNDMLAALDSERFSVASDEEKAAFVQPFVDAIVGERERVVEENAPTRWICVYKDTLCRHADVDNLVNIEVPAAWLYNALRAEGETDIEAWFDEYTADATDTIARNAVTCGVVLGCDDEYVWKSVCFARDNPELIEAADRVREWLDSFDEYDAIPDDIAFEFKGIFVKDPFYDEVYYNEVDPFVYYGVENIKGYLEKVKVFMGERLKDSLDDSIDVAKREAKVFERRDCPVDVVER